MVVERYVSSAIVNGDVNMRKHILNNAEGRQITGIKCMWRSTEIEHKNIYKHIRITFASGGRKTQSKLNNPINFIMIRSLLPPKEGCVIEFHAPYGDQSGKISKEDIGNT